MTFLPRLARLVLDEVHCITPAGAEAVLRALDGRIGSISADSFVGDPVLDERRGGIKYRMHDGGVAVVPVHGELVSRGGWIGARSGLVSYEGLRHVLREAQADKRVSAIVLDVDSPGGMAAGMTETAALIRAIAAEKPITAVGNPLSASAAYGLSASCSRIVAGPDAQIGSIGVVYVHADYSGQLSQQGVRVTLIHAGAHKVDGNPFEPLSADVRADIQRRIDAAYERFVAIVRAGRPQLSDAAVRGTEARVYAADEAVQIGLADEVGTFEEAVASARIAARRPPNSRRSISMSHASTDQPGWAGMTVSEIGAAVAHLRSAIGADAVVAAGTAHTNGPVAAMPTATEEQPVAVAPERVDEPVAAAAMETASDAHARGRADERARISAILGSDEARTRQAQAMVLALESDLGADAALAMLIKMPSETASGGASEFYAAVAASGGAPNVGHVTNADELGAMTGRERGRAIAERYKAFTGRARK